MEDRPQQASGLQQPLPRRVPNRRMPTSAEAARRVPVTPGISFGTYDESPMDSRLRPPATDYFSSSGHSSSSKAPSEISLQEIPEQVNGRDKSEVSEAQSKGSVISATFTLPQIIQLDKSDIWVSPPNCSIERISLTAMTRK